MIRPEILMSRGISDIARQSRGVKGLNAGVPRLFSVLKIGDPSSRCLAGVFCQVELPYRSREKVKGP